MFRCVGGPPGAATAEESVLPQLRDYFQLDEPLAPLYTNWAAADPRMAAVSQVMPGMRVLRQEPVECLFSFICSSNNNIARIGGMLQALRAAYGEPLRAAEGAFEPPAEDEAQANRYYAFPTLQRLAAASDAELRALGLGYRADYVRRSAALAAERGGVEWLLQMRATAREQVRTELCELPGVGPKARPHVGRQNRAISAATAAAAASRRCARPAAPAPGN